MAFDPIEIALPDAALDYAAVHMLKRAKRAPSSPAIVGDDGRPDRDYVGIVCELAFYEWRYGSWLVRKAVLDREQFKVGSHDGGEDDVGINVKGSNLPAHRQLDEQHLLVSADPRNRGELIPHIRYIAAFWAHDRRLVMLAGYRTGTDIARICPEPRRPMAHGLLSYMVKVTNLRPMHLIPHARLAA